MPALFQVRVKSRLTRSVHSLRGLFSTHFISNRGRAYRSGTHRRAKGREINIGATREASVRPVSLCASCYKEHWRRFASILHKKLKLERVSLLKNIIDGPILLLLETTTCRLVIHHK